MPSFSHTILIIYIPTELSHKFITISIRVKTLYLAAISVVCYADLRLKVTTSYNFKIWTTVIKSTDGY